MKIFLSWSTEPSKFIAEALKDWIPFVIQAARPWFSATDIDRGVRWSGEIGNELAETEFGILCMTPENLNAPWILFEAGALSKKLTTAHVVPVLFNLKPTELVGPLAQFNATQLNKEDMRKLIQTINKTLENPLEKTAIDRTFDQWWSVLEEKLLQVPKIEVLKEDKRTEKELLEEILTLVRAQSFSVNTSLLNTSTFPKSATVTQVIDGMVLEFSHKGDNLTPKANVYHPKFGKGKVIAIGTDGFEKWVHVKFEASLEEKTLKISETGLALIISNEN
jgi:TIR domain